MNTFQWVGKAQEKLVEDGQLRLAQILDAIPSLVSRHEHETLDALMPEALSLTHQAAQQQSWLEIYLRHWNLQSHILHRMETADWLAEAVELLEFAHREENIACPHTTHVTQNLTVAYAQHDGTGFASERLQLALETLDRIDPQWSSFASIAAQYASALIDDGRPKEALEFAQTQLKALEMTLPKDDYDQRRGDLEEVLVEALAELGQVAEALDRCRGWIELMEHTQATHQQLSAQLELTRLLCLQDQGQEAMKMMPEGTAIQGTPSLYLRAARALAALIQVEVIPNAWQLNRSIWSMAQHLEGKGAYTPALKVAQIHAELAIARGQGHIAQQSLNMIGRILSELRKPEATEALHQHLHEAIEALPQRVVPPQGSAEQAVAAISGDPEADLPMLQAATTQYPTDDALLWAYAEAWEAAGFQGHALDVLHEGFIDHPNSDRLMLLGTRLLEVGDNELLHQLIADHRNKEGSIGAGAHWLRGLWAQQRHDTAEAAEAFVHVVALMPRWSEPRVMAATELRTLGRLDEALALLNDQIALFHPNKAANVDWDRMAVATLLGRWPDMHDSARRVGFPPQDEDGPFEVEPFELCSIAFSSEPGAPTYLSERVGPVTARIRTLAHHGAPQHGNDLVVFEATPLNPRPANHPKDQPYVNTYAAIAVLEPGNMRPTLPIDGIHPGAAHITRIAKAIDPLGVKLQPFSGDAYQLPHPDPDQDGTVLGFYGGIGIPETTSLTDAHAALTTVIQTLEHPLFWPELLRLIGPDGEDDLNAQLEAMDRYHVAENA